MQQQLTGNYDFKKDIIIAKSTEQEISKLLYEHYGVKTLEISKNKYYDLKVLLPNKKEKLIEIKEDFQSYRTGNLALEFECREKPSGIAITNASLFIYKLHENKIVYWATTTKTFKNMIANRRFSRVVNGGDKNSNSLNYLFSIELFKQYSKQLFV